MEISKEQKEAIEYLKTRLYGNKGCKYIDVAQEDLRIFINLVDRKEKDIEGWKKYCEEIEEEQTEMSNKNCELEFEVEKLKKENEELKEKIREHTLLISPYYVKENYISIQTIKDIVEELEKNIFRIKKQYSNGGENCNTSYLENLAQIKILKQILKESEE